eukprot:3816392-Rhodomonas_salina.1
MLVLSEVTWWSHRGHVGTELWPRGVQYGVTLVLSCGHVGASKGLRGVTLVLSCGHVWVLSCGHVGVRWGSRCGLRGSTRPSATSLPSASH